MKSTTFHTKSATFYKNKQDQVNMCICIYHQISPKYNIYLVGLPSPNSIKGQVIMRDLCWISCICCISVLFIESDGFIQKVPLFMKTNKTRSICVYTCTIYTYMHHHIPTKMIYLVGLPSVLYERPGQNKRSLLNQLFLLFFSGVFQSFSCTFHEKHHFSYKKCHFSWKQTRPGQYW